MADKSSRGRGDDPLGGALGDPSLAALRGQLEAAAASFVGDAAGLGELLRAMVADVDRAAAEPLEIFPVKHHSPASALHMVRRLRERPPRVIFMEGCDDLGAALEGLEHCRFPVALQAYAPEAPAFPGEWTPLSLVAPLTEFSAEYQAIACALGREETALVFVDRSVDHVFQWLPREGPPPGEAGGADGAVDEGGPTGDDSDSEGDGEGGGAGDTAGLHGGAVGLQIGATAPTFGEFLEVLLRNARVRHYSEWWSQYVEGPTLAADYATYRCVFFLVGSLLRRLGISERDRQEDAARERYMWARIRGYLRDHQIDPKDAIYVCGALHAVSPIEEFGVCAPQEWAITPRTATAWNYGIVPSSYAAIERQFGLPAGELALAEAMWTKGLRAHGLTPFKITSEDAAAGGKPPGKKTSKKTSKKASAKASTKASEEAALGSPEEAVAKPAGEALGDFLQRPPAFLAADDDQLLRWCVDIVRLARKHGYMASTADTIAIHHTSTLLANLRDRPHPTAYDFQDAAITCLEKDRTPRRRTIARLTEILLGGDRLGRVGYASLPPLAQDVYDRLAVLGINLKSARIERALLDIQNRPELLPASDLLWRLRYLGLDVRPIMGERTLGHKPRQESWDIGLGKRQGSLIELGYAGTTVEQVLEARLRRAAYDAKARAATALAAAEDSILYLRSGRLTRELGLRATALLQEEVGASDAPEIFRRVRGLVHYYRTVGLPEWIRRFVSTGYRHYATLLPFAFSDRGTAPRELAAMLAFIFTQESLALAMGCERSQLLIALAQAEPEDPPKVALFWAAQWLVGLRSEDEVRQGFVHLLENPLLLPTFPEAMAGFLLALEFTPRIARLAVELLSRAFGDLPDPILEPWLPSLVVTLRPLGAPLIQALIKEAGLAFPRDLGALPGWVPPWERALPASLAEAAAASASSSSSSSSSPEKTAAAAPSGPSLSPEEAALAALLAAHSAAPRALAARIAISGEWGLKPPDQAVNIDSSSADGGSSPQNHASASPATPATPLGQLLADHPATLVALLARLEGPPPSA